MTGVVHHGTSGTYKTSAIVQQTLIPELIGKNISEDKENPEIKGRELVTNIRGFNSLDRIEEAMECTVAEDSAIHYVDPDAGPKSWEAMQVWFHWAPIGALIGFDEAAKIYPKRRIKDFRKFDLPLYDAQGNKNPPEYIKKRCPYWDGNYDRPETLEEAIDLHRHYHWDLYFSCTNIAKLHDEFRQNIEVAYRHKSLGELVPWKKGKWKEFAHDAEFSGKSVSHHQGTPKEYKVDPRVFDCYLSTKDGKSKTSSENRSIFRDPKLRFFGACFVLSITALIYFMVSIGMGSPEVAKALKTDPEVIESNVPEVAHNVDGDASDKLPVEIRITPDNNVVQTPEIIREPVIQPLDAFHRYVVSDNRMALSAVLTVVSSGKLHYRISIYDGYDVIDQFDQEQIVKFGYEQTYDRAGLLLTKNDVSVLVRPMAFMVTKGATKGANDAAMQGGSDVQSASYTF